MPKDTKTALLNSAEAAARAAGFDGFSYADLAADVGIRKASIHHHFPTKAALALALIQRYGERMAEALAEIDAAQPTAAGRLRALIDIYRAALNEGQSLCLCVAFSTGRDSLPETVTAGMARFRRMMTDWIEAVLTLGQSDGTIADIRAPGLEAAALLPLLEGAQLAARSEVEPSYFDTAVQLLLARCAEE